ncbi:MAG: hypothetical protein JWM89_4057 [Acidimicrobiales bacterium]|nr:hypothetical protein [Acidimicrobiales bacterium]
MQEVRDESAAVPSPPWGDEDAIRLGLARTRMGLTQKRLAERFDATQGSASRWQRVPTPQQPAPGRVAALRDFCAQVLDGQDEEFAGPEPVRPEAHEEGREDNDVGSTSDSDAFADAIWLSTGERALADRQAALVDATINHLATTTEGYTEADGAAHRWCAQVLGLGYGMAPPDN